MRIINFLLIPQKRDSLKMGKSSLPPSHIYDYVLGYFFGLNDKVLGYFGQFRQYVISVYFFYLSTIYMVFWWF